MQFVILNFTFSLGSALELYCYCCTYYIFQSGREVKCGMKAWLGVLPLTWCQILIVLMQPPKDSSASRHQFPVLSVSVSGSPSVIYTRCLVFTSLEQLCSCLVGPASWSLEVHHYQFHPPAICFLSHNQYFPWINRTVSSLHPCWHYQPKSLLH